MEIPIKMDDLGGKPTIFGNTQNSIPTNQQDRALNLKKLELVVEPMRPRQIETST